VAAGRAGSPLASDVKEPLIACAMGAAVGVLLGLTLRWAGVPDVARLALIPIVSGVVGVGLGVGFVSRRRR
jgi:hypothetical protein